MSKDKRKKKVPNKFKSNGCNCVPDLNLEKCCRVHDFRYWSHPHRLSYFERKEADQEFRDCIKEKGHPYIAVLYYLGVRLFGWLFYYTDPRGKNKGQDPEWIAKREKRKAERKSELQEFKKKRKEEKKARLSRRDNRRIKALSSKK